VPYKIKDHTSYALIINKNKIMQNAIINFKNSRPFNKEVSKVLFFKKCLFFALLLFCLHAEAATITSTTTGGTWSTGSSWVGGVTPGTADTAIIVSGATVTLTAARTVTNVTINAGGRLNIGTVNALTVTGTFVNNGTFTATSGRLYLTGTAGSFTNTGTFTFGSGRIYFYGNVTGFGTHTLISTSVRFYGTATQSIAGFTTSGLISMLKTGGVATFTGNVSGAGFTINGNGGTLNLGVGLTHTTTTRVTLSNGNLNGGSSTLNINGVTTSAWSGTGSRFTAGTSTVRFNAAGNQTLSASATTFNNLTFSTSGTKTLNTGNCTVTGIVSMEGTATVSSAPTYGSNASLRYNTIASRTSGAEWIATFAALGGVNITNTGTITMNAAKVLNASVPLAINSGATLTTGSFQLTLGGNFTNAGTFNAGSSPIVIANTMATQSIAGFSTTGSLSMTKTTGTATLSSNVTAGALTINGLGGILNLGSTLTHNFNGVITLTNGTLNGGSATLNVNTVSTTAWNGTGSRFTAGTSTVRFNATGNQTLSASATTFNNLTFSNSGIKTLTTANCTVNGVVSIEGTATVSATPTYGANASLQYNTTITRTAGVEWITPFAALGGVTVANTGVITMNAAKVFNASVPLTVSTGANLNSGNFQLTFGGNFINNGTVTLGNSPIVITNTMANQSIGGFTTTGLVSMTKTAGVATLAGNVNATGLTINGSGGTLHLGTSLIHTITGNITGTTGTLHGGSSTLRFSGALSGTGGTFTPGTSTIDYNGTTQSVVVVPYYNLSLSGSGTKTMTGTLTVSNAIVIASGVVANLGTGLIHTSLGLSLGAAFQVSGSWGGSGSGAANINTTYFATATGRINNNCSVPNITVQPTTPAATCAGVGVQTISVSTTGSGLTYFWRKGGVALTNGGVVSGQGTATLVLTGATTAEAGSYDVVVSGTCSSSVTSTAVTVTVNPTPIITAQPVARTVCQNTPNSFTVATSVASPTYQWQYATNPVTTWTNTNSLVGVTGSTSNALSWMVTPLSHTNLNFRCIVTGANGCAITSNVALLTVNPTPTVGSVSTNQAVCIGGFPDDDITVSSATGTIQWQQADNTGFTLNLTNLGTNSTTLTIAEIGELTSTKYYRAVVSSGACMSVMSGTVAVAAATTTWISAAGGSWSNGAPNSKTAAVISYDYTSSEDLNACSLTVTNGANVVISSGDNINLFGSLTVSSGTFTLNNNANLVQETDAANTGNIIVKRASASLMRQDYALWSSPVTGQQLQSFSPNTLSNRFYTYNPTANNYSVVASPSTTDFEIGTGYLIRMPNNHPATPLAWTGSFSGAPNNGPYSVPVTIGTYNAIGNPYPSTIDADAFINNNGITEALYFWRKTNNAATSSYATYTTAGGVSNSVGDPLGLTPNGMIQVGQGFIAKATSSSFDFENSMRVEDNDDQFFRLIQEDKNRVWLNLTSASGYFGQTLVAYMDGATLGIDAAIDGRYINDYATALTSMIDSEEFAIQGRPLPFDTSDRVALGFKSIEAGSFTISINQVDGFFETENQAIYLQDHLTNTIHNLQDGAYNFASEVGVFNTRFELVFEDLLSTEQNAFTSNAVVVYKQNQNCVVNTGNIAMRSIVVYDIQGRLLFEKEEVNATEFHFALPASNEMLLVKIISEENETVTKKIMN
jgi:hypothetical protein